MNLAPFVVHTWSSGGAAMSKAVSIVRNADNAATRVNAAHVDEHNNVKLARLGVAFEERAPLRVTPHNVADTNPIGRAPRLAGEGTGLAPT